MTVMCINHVKTVSDAMFKDFSYQFDQSSWVLVSPVNKPRSDEAMRDAFASAVIEKLKVQFLGVSMAEVEEEGEERGRFFI